MPWVKVIITERVQREWVIEVENQDTAFEKCKSGKAGSPDQEFRDLEWSHVAGLTEEEKAELSIE